MKEGLPSVNVFDIIQDQQGYIWLSTLNGLVKYDGYTFKTFRKDAKDSLGLSPVGRSFTTSLLAKDGTIWVSTLTSGFSHLDPYTERFTNYPNPPKEEGEAEFARTYLVKEDVKGRIWMFEIDVPTRRARVKNYDPETDSISTFEVGHAFTGRITIKSTFQRFLVEDQEGGIWVHDPEKGVFKYDEESQEFLLVLAAGEEAAIKGNTQQIIVDRDNQLWIATSQGVQVYDIENKRWNQDKLGKQESLFVHALYQDQRGNIWVSPEGKEVWKYGAQDQQLQPFSLKDDLSVKGFPTYYLQAVAEDEEGVWFMNDVPRFLAYNRKFVYYQHKTQSFTYYGEKFNQPQNQPNYLPLAFLRDDSGLLWITNNGSGINKQNPLSQRIDQWKYVADDVYSLGVDTLTNVQEDLDKEIWIMGYGKIQQFDPTNSTFNSFSPTSEGSVKFNSLVDNGEGSLWLGSDQGLYLFNKVNSRFQLKLPMGKGEASSLTPLFFDQDEKLWIRFNGESFLGESGQALAIFDPTKGRIVQEFSYDPQDTTGLSSNIIYGVIQDAQDRIWISSFGGGLSKYDPASKQFTHYKHDPEDPHSISENNVIRTYEDSQQRLWVSTVNQGLNLYREESNDFLRWNENGLLFPRPVIEGKEGNAWIGSISGEGLYKINPETEELSYFNKQNGLASENVFSIALDKKGDLWMPSESGLTRFDPQTETSTVFDKDDGFGSLANEGEQFFFQPVTSENGDIWFHSITRLYRIQPDKLLTKDPTLPKVLISGLTIGDEHLETAGHSLLEDHISRTPSLTLNHDQNELTFEFVGLHFAHAEENLYSYKLEGVDEDWTTPSYERRARYPNLPPGSYTFRVRASNADELWNEEGARLKITISRAWWETPFAYLIYLALVGAGIWYFVKWRTRKQEEKIKQGEEDLAKERELTEQLTSLDRLKDQFIANTSHELRTPLNGIMGLSEGIYDRTTNTTDKEDLSLIISSSRRLHSLVDDLLDFSKLKNAEFEIQKVPTDLSSVVDLVLRMSEPSARKNKVSLQKDIPASLPAVHADPQRLQQIFYNLLGNAIKFTKEGEVKVLAEVVERKVKISISDTGIGIAEDKQKVIFEEFQQADGSTARQFGGTGLGLSITKQLVNLHGGEIGVESVVGEGSTFWFTLDTSDEEGISIMSTDDQKSFLSVAVDGSPKELEPEKASESAELLATAVSSSFTSSDKLRILVVDDEPVNQRVMKSHLMDSHFFLAFADDGPSALKLIEESPQFDLVLLDVMMPNMSGYEVCKQLREQYLPSELPVIMVTAKNQVDDLVQGLKEGANDYLAKPFSKQELLARIKTQLDLNHIFNIAGRFIPNEFIRTLGHERLTEVQFGDLVEREVCVLFTDIRNYTTLSESMSPEDNFYFINGYTNRMGPIIKGYHGFVNQYLGDGIMAIFQDKADDALRAMIGMQNELREYNVERRQKSRPEIAVGMGLHSGPLIMGIIGDSQRTDAATISDTVNTAARMEGLTKHFGARILISGSSYKDLSHPDEFRFRYIGKVKVKGKNDEVEVYECIEGDAEEEKALKWELREKFDLAVKHFYQHQFELTAKLAKEIMEANPQDKVIQYFYQESLVKQ